tara:strand:+ start:200 stop:661 length:462 start_codon:yes stop_codon:yes gene_type:complete
MFKVVLVEPEIPPNTGNIIRLCANTGVDLHLVKPLGFPLDHSKLLRAGLDYHEYTSVEVHINWYEFIKKVNPRKDRIFTFTTKSNNIYSNHKFFPGDTFVFGPETRGLSPNILGDFDEKQRLKLPMQNYSRSINLSNVVAVTIFEAWRQNKFF